MTTNAKTKQEMEDVLRKAVHMVLDLPDTDERTVRFPYGSDISTPSAPSFTNRENVVFVHLLPEDSEINKERYTGYEPNEDDEGLTYFNAGTECYRVNFVCYGPMAFDWARKLRAFICSPPVLGYLCGNNLHPVPAIAAPVPMPECINTEWYDRYDVSVLFNVAVKHEQANAVPAAAEPEIILKPTGRGGRKPTTKGKVKNGKATD